MPPRTRGTAANRRAFRAHIAKTADGATGLNSSRRPAIVEFLRRKWARELDYRLINELWAFSNNRISVRFQYEWHDDSENWFRSYGNEQWEFDDDGLMRRREASINDVPIKETERKFLWKSPGPRPFDHPGLTELGL